MEIMTLPEWIFAGAKVLMHSAVFGFVRVFITEINNLRVGFEPVVHGTEYVCGMSYQNFLRMVAEGEVKPCNY
jgi:hypothetical protein